MYSHDVLSDLVKTDEKERLESARTAWLVKQARAGRPKLRERFLTRSGAFLVLTGHRLQARYGAGTAPRLTRDRPLPEGAPCDC
jgi:hypothetical protein